MQPKLKPMRVTDGVRVAVQAERWQNKNNGSTWRIVSFKEVKSFQSSDITVGLTGPGPCRGFKYLPLKEFFENWVKVPERKTI